MVPGRPLGEEEITSVLPNHDHTQRAVMEQMLGTIKQIRTTCRTEEMEDSISETEMEVARSNLEEMAMTKKLEVTQRNLYFPAEFAEKPLTQTY